MPACADCGTELLIADPECPTCTSKSRLLWSGESTHATDNATEIAQERPIGQSDTWRQRWSVLEERHDKLVRSLASSDTSTALLTEEAEDFFVRCHSLGDHLITERVLQRAEVETFRNGSPALTICADLANTSKHGIPLTKSIRLDPNTKITRIDVTLKVGEGSSHRIYVESSGQRHDVEVLAGECLGDWRTFLVGRNLI